MISQTKLKELKNSLNSTFNVLTREEDVTRYMNSWMRENHPFTGIYTDARCSELLDDAITHIETQVNRLYAEIASDINKEIDELQSILSSGHGILSFSENNLQHLAIGAGAGIGAAIILGGPVVWLVGAGALLGALYNSSQKKKELMNRILHTAQRINGEAISKLTTILDKLILPEPKMIPVHKAMKTEAPVLQLPPVERLTPQQVSVKTFLERRGIKYLVHFTDKANYDSIMKNGILSLSEAKRRGILVRRKDNDISSHSIDPYMRSDSEDYISLSVTKVNEDLIRAYRASGRIGDVIVFYIDASILWKEMSHDRFYCNMNASKREVSFGRDIESFEAMFSQSISQSDYMTGRITTYDRSVDGRKPDEPTHPRAEILFEKSVDPKYLIDKVEEY